jgi:hypothetical protein
MFALIQRSLQMLRARRLLAVIGLGMFVVVLAGPTTQGRLIVSLLALAVDSEAQI